MTSTQLFCLLGFCQQKFSFECFFSRINTNSIRSCSSYVLIYVVVDKVCINITINIIINNSSQRKRGYPIYVLSNVIKERKRQEPLFTMRSFCESRIRKKTNFLFDFMGLLNIKSSHQTKSHIGKKRKEKKEVRL